LFPWRVILRRELHKMGEPMSGSHVAAGCTPPKENRFEKSKKRRILGFDTNK
jgi:hypothetical protein